MWIICLLVLLNGFFFEKSEAQTTLSYFVGDTVKLSCALSGTFTYPSWRGPPSSTKYTNQDDVTGAINSAAYAYGRLVYDSDNKTLLLSRAMANDSGSYSCSYGGIGSHTITLTVTEKNCKCECECKCGIFAGLCVAFGILGASGLLIAIGGICIECFDEMKKQKTLLLASCVIGIVCDVLGLVFSIVVKVIDCCEENCEDSCCKDDSECCKEDSKCCDDWIVNSAIAFIVIPCLAIVASVVIFILVKLDIIGPGSNGGNGFFCFNNGNDGGDDGGNDGGNNRHHRGHGTNSSTVHSERADTHRGTLSDRANSEGEVSRKDVHVQEKTGDNFSGRRPMPPIPLTDKKGRGLSANYDDEHPMISVGIPDKKAGDLGPLEEESKKKKKKKKKTKNDGDEREKEENKE